MDSAEFLDLLGNANRRRILRLLSQKPCYVTEISEFLGVSPKAVIDHLEKLDEAGLVESRTDDRRRKYFSISRHVRLEVTVSPYEFGTKRAYPASSRLDITTWQRVSIDLNGESQELKPDGRESPPTDNGTDVAAMARRLREFQQLDRELSMAQRWTQGRITDLRETLADRVEISEPRLVSELLVALADEPARTEALSRRLDAPPQVLNELLDALADEGVVRRDGRRWHLVE
jgi:ArsR family transcriptional regulator